MDEVRLIVISMYILFYQYVFFIHSKSMYSITHDFIGSSLELSFWKLSHHCLNMLLLFNETIFTVKNDNIEFDILKLFLSRCFKAYKR